MQLEQYLNYFPESDILIITLEELYTHRRQTLEKVFGFLKVDNTFYSPNFEQIKNKANEKRRKSQIGMLLKWVSETNIGKMFSSEIRRNLGQFLYLPFSQKIERPTIDQELRETLIDYLRDDINRLRAYTGCDFEGWCV